VYLGVATTAADEVHVADTLTIGPGGVLNGTGTINGGAVGTSNVAVVNSGGRVDPGVSPGTLTIEGSFEQTAGTLVLEVGGATQGRYDRIVATGGLRFSGGQIVLRTVDGYTGAGEEGTVFSFFAGSAVDFTGFNFATGFIDQSGMGWTLNPDGSASFTTPVPEPGTWALMLLGAAGIAARVRRARPASPSGV